jgi:RND family efflux transporter MFP subunit
MRLETNFEAGLHILRPLIVLASLAVISCSGNETDQERKIVRPAKLIEVEASRSVRTVRFPAIIEAASSAEVTFQVGGLLKELPVRAGQEVEKGALIARLEQRNFLNEVATAEAQFARAEAQFDRANSAFLRTERLLAQDATSRRVFEEAQSAAKEADAARDVARAALDTARKQLEDATLRSPFSGLIAVVHAERFQNVAAQEPIVTLQTTGTAEAVFQVPARVVATAGQFETEETVVLLDALPDVRIPAVFQSATSRADPDTQTFTVEYAFAPPDELIVLPGMTGMVESRWRFSREGESTSLPGVPTSAIMSDGEARFVWVVDESTMTVSRREVTVAPGVGESLAVLDGLVEGEVIVGAGASYLHDGMQIRPYNQ